MTTNRTRKTVKQPTDRQPKAREADQPAPLTEDDYRIDPTRVLRVLGVDPATVIEDSVRLALHSGAVVLEYGVRRAVPPRMMGMALLAGIPQEEPDGQDE